MAAPCLQERTPQRLILDGFPRVGYDNGGSSQHSASGFKRCPEDVSFLSCLRTILEYLGEDLGYSFLTAYNTTWRLDHTFTYLMGVSGCAFRLSWKPGWFEDNADFRYMSADPGAPAERALAAVGYQAVLDGAQDQRTEVICREAIVRSLRQLGRPVIAFGVIGPPEACLITGYDEGGRVLIGWNDFQTDPRYNAGVTFERSGEFRKRNWFGNLQNLLILGQRKPIPDRAVVYTSALHWALHVMRATRTRSGRHIGAAAFAAWVAHLQMDQAFPPGDLDTLRQRFHVHDCMVGALAGSRWYAARFMEMVVANEPAMEADLLDAADCFEDEHDLMWQAWGLVGGSGRSDDHVLRLANPQVRREVVQLIAKAQAKDLQAAGLIARALQLRK